MENIHYHVRLYKNQKPQSMPIPSSEKLTKAQINLRNIKFLKGQIP